MKLQKRIIVELIIVILAIGLIFMITRRSDRCTAGDRAQNNCVPAGRSTPPGVPREATIDCKLKNYDHKFSG